MTKASLPAPSDESALYVVDLSGYIYRAYHAMPPLSTAKGEITNAVYGVTNMLLKLVKDTKPFRLAVAADTKSSFRKERYAGYKTNRNKMPDDLVPQVPRVFEVVEAYAMPVLGAEGFEADDVIATLVGKARAAGLRTVIVSADKDLLQLVADDVVMYDTMRDKVFDAAATIEKMGVPPHQVRDLLALTGDTSDNIPGVPSVGPKTAAQLLADYGDLDGIYANLESLTKKALKQKLIENKDNAYLSRELVTLREDVPMTLDLEAMRYGGWDHERLRAILTELEFTRMLDLIATGRDSAPPAPKAAPAVAAAKVNESYRVVSEPQALAEAAAAIAKAGTVTLFASLDGSDPLRGELVGLALAWSPDDAIYVPFGHRYLGAPSQPTAAAALEILRPVLERADIVKESDDLKRDEVALARHGVSLRGGRFDTMLASYLLDPEKHGHDLEAIARAELGIELRRYDAVIGKQRGQQKHLGDIEVELGRDYAAERVSVVRALGPRYRDRIATEKVAKLYDELEIPLAHVLADMERVGVRIDSAKLGAMSIDVATQLRAIEAKCFALAGREFNVGSPRQLETVLFDELHLPVIKKTKTGRSTDAEVLEDLAIQHDLPHAILEHRTLSKLKGTYLDALPRQVSPETGRVHARMNQAVAATGRISSSDPNLQNIPIRTEMGRTIRDAFIAADGFEMLSADYSQIELRVLAHLSEDPQLLEAFGANEDVHVRTATALFDVPREGVTREMRGQAKTVNFAVIYGQTQFALARNLRIERSEAARYIKAFFDRYAGVARYMERLVEEARSTGGVRTLMGRWRAIPDIHSKNRGLRQAAERVARNTPIQGSAADIIKRAMVDIHADFAQQELASRMVLTVHDELVLEVAPKEKERVLSIVTSRMEGAMKLKVPLSVGHGFGASWGEAH